ncbi:hypothetical protein M5D96_007879, partial [Drosophila gunungcola]
VKYCTGLGSSTHNVTAPSRRLTKHKKQPSRIGKRTEKNNNNKSCSHCNCGHEAGGVIQKEHHIVRIWRLPARDWDG